MDEIQQARADLRFVRGVMDRRTPGLQGFAIVYYLSAIYVAIGFALMDIEPNYANWFFIIGAAVSTAALRIFYGPAKRREAGEIDQVRLRQNTLHWAGGIWGSVLATAALAYVVPELRGPVGGQVTVLLVGVVYFMWGIYRDRLFLLLGPLLMVGTVFVGLMPRYRWTTLGGVMAAGLLAAGILTQRSTTVLASSGSPPASEL
jgi:hypothetical protein